MSICFYADKSCSKRDGDKIFMKIEFSKKEIYLKDIKM